jgi:hypothetical protein
MLGPGARTLLPARNVIKVIRPAPSNRHPEIKSPGQRANQNKASPGRTRAALAERDGPEAPGKVAGRAGTACEPRAAGNPGPERSAAGRDRRPVAGQRPGQGHHNGHGQPGLVDAADQARRPAGADLEAPRGLRPRDGQAPGQAPQPVRVRTVRKLISPQV